MATVHKTLHSVLVYFPFGEKSNDFFFNPLETVKELKVTDYHQHCDYEEKLAWIAEMTGERYGSELISEIAASLVEVSLMQRIEKRRVIAGLLIKTALQDAHVDSLVEGLDLRGVLCKMEEAAQGMSPFVEACVNENSVKELAEGLTMNPDHGDMQEWDLTPNQWRESIRTALLAKAYCCGTYDYISSIREDYYSLKHEFDDWVNCPELKEITI